MRRAALALLALGVGCRAEPAGGEERPALSSPWLAVPVESPPRPLEELLPLGERLYGWNCLPCHGAEGRGDGPVAERIGLRPRDFTGGAFKFKTSSVDEMPFDADLFRTVTVGVPHSGMPPFSQTLGTDDRWAVVAYVKSLSQRPLPDGTARNAFEAWPARTVVGPPPADGDPSRGVRLFRETAQCARCHGPEGRGDGPAAAGLVDSAGRPVAMPDLSRGEVLFQTGNRREDVYRVLTTGLAGTPMPSFASLPERDRADLAAFITTLYRPIPPGERLFLARGCVACHTLGRGKLIGPDLAGVTRRRSAEWLRRWLRDPSALIAADPDARKLYEEYGSAMPAPDLNPEEIEAVIRYLGNR